MDNKPFRNLDKPTQNDRGYAVSIKVTADIETNREFIIITTFFSLGRWRGIKPLNVSANHRQNPCSGPPTK